MKSPTISVCGTLKENASLKENGTIRRCGPFGVGVVFLELMCHCGGRICTEGTCFPGQSGHFTDLKVIIKKNIIYLSGHMELN